jgi:hypothetical protein
MFADEYRKHYPYIACALFDPVNVAVGTKIRNRREKKRKKKKTRIIEMGNL